jgi:DNA-binding transcriptional ArsR family regulator
VGRYTVEDIPLGYAPVPPEMLLHRPKLKDADVRVWCALAMHRSLKTGRTSAGVARIAGILGVDRSTVTRAIARLIEAGFLLRRRQRRDDESGRFAGAEYVLAVGGWPVQLALVHRRTGEEEGGEHRGATSHHGSPHRDAHRGASVHTERRGEEDKENPTDVGARGRPPHRADTYVRKVSSECALLGVPLDAGERRNLGRYVKGLIEKHGADAKILLRFCSHYATRRAESPRIRPSQAWSDVAGGTEVSGGAPIRDTRSTAVVGATETSYEGDF